MSNIVNSAVVRPIVATLLAVHGWIFQAVVFAQDAPKKVDVNVDVKTPGGAGTAWYGNWWIWAIGVAVFLIIIVALTNRGSTREA
ncbi:MAG: hypothetical protein ABI876_18680 [Bacteroidota bacterium]